MKLLAVLLGAAVLVGGGDKVQIKDVKAGEGTEAKVGDLLTVHYTGKLKDGKTFDSSVGKKPLKVLLGAGQVIQGWETGLLGMKETGKRELVIPPSLAYGEAGFPGAIPPNATLTFDVELLKIERIEVKTTKKGSGQPVKRGDSVEVHYTGKFLDGKKFDSSVDRGTPFAVVVGTTRLIQGFTQGLIGMKLGEKRTVTIPPGLGYGDVERGPIPANSTLVFELELITHTPKGE